MMPLLILWALTMIELSCAWRKISLSSTTGTEPDVHGGGDHSGVRDDLELLAVLGVIGPFALDLDDLPRQRGQEVADNRYEILTPVDFKPRNSIAVLFVREGNLLDLTLKFNKHSSILAFHWLSSVSIQNIAWTGEKVRTNYGTQLSEKVD